MGERYEWAFHQRRDIGMTKKHRKDVPYHQSLEKYKTTMRYYFIPTKMPINKKITSINEDMGKLEPHTVLVGLQNGATIF